MAMVFYRAVGAAAPITGRPTELAFFLVLVVYMNLNGAVAAAAPMTAGFTVTTRAHVFPFCLMCGPFVRQVGWICNMAEMAGEALSHVYGKSQRGPRVVLGP